MWFSLLSQWLRDDKTGATPSKDGHHVGKGQSCPTSPGFLATIQDRHELLSYLLSHCTFGCLRQKLIICALIHQTIVI